MPLFTLKNQSSSTARPSTTKMISSQKLNSETTTAILNSTLRLQKRI
eukprot:CAMPEP_0202972394 /NCGR_PEP_ID=MMETSP1396-20130829/36117_1 /ASSEMBLY_ACC=CAM_ASM_000872 /TAXON_ID= /ORGANISM="Pseudokeronopsis sp., Strain Brazil" /LENGTH=46 /DNA_ID= /DNA_START= /DNA_END= /DNA_ORIENTATION=